MATRCFWPPESSAGRWWIRSPKPEPGEDLDAALVHLRGRARPECRGHPHVLDRRKRAEQVVLLEDEADVLAQLDPAALAGVRQVVAEDVEAALLASRRSAPMRVSKVDLPEPDGPGHDHDLAPADLQVVVEEHLGPRLAGAVGVVHALRPDHHVGAGGLHDGHGGDRRERAGVSHGGAHESLHLRRRAARDRPRAASWPRKPPDSTHITTDSTEDRSTDCSATGPAAARSPRGPSRNSKTLTTRPAR